MRKFIKILIIAMITLPQVIHVTTLQAAVRKNVGENAGERCNPPPIGSGMVFGSYTGTTDNPNKTMTFTRCFASIEECQGWLYTLRSKYVDGNSVLIGCKKR